MTLIDIGGRLFFPPTWGWKDHTTLALDATNEKVGHVFHVPKTGTLKKICFYTGTVTTGDTIDIRIETIAVNGAPSGTLYAVDATGSQAVADGDDNAGFWVAINSSTGISVTAGDVIAIVCSLHSSGNLRLVSDTPIGPTGNFPYSLHYTSSWAMVDGTRGQYCAISLEYSDGICPFGVVAGNIAATSYSTSSNPDHIGNRIKFPVSVRAIGIWALVDLDGNANAVLYDSDGSTVLASVSMNKYYRGYDGGYIHYCRFSSPQTLDADTYYRVVIAPNTTTALSIYAVSVVDDGAYAGLDAMEMGDDCHYSVCEGAPANEAAWTQTTTKRASCGLIVDQIDTGGAAGGVVGAGGLHGGFQL